jgi:predicted DCC family thiol-disulfide oxidoreductase YuxK
MLPDGTQSPLLSLFPNLLALVDAPRFVEGLVAVAAVAAGAFACGYHDKVAAFFLWYVLACLFGRNPLIANPALPYVGWMLLAHLLIPSKPLALPSQAKGSIAPARWEMPIPIFVAAWIAMALAYSYSGYTKLLSPSWLNGDAISYVLQNPLARDHFLRAWLVTLPEGVLGTMTFGVMWLELLFAPLALIRRFRPILWGAMFSVQIGFLCLLNFADLTLPMLLFHLLTFDPDWVRGTRAAKKETIFYDGSCGLCHRVVQFVLAEDRRAHFVLSPLQGSTYTEMVTEQDRRRLPDSFVVMDHSGRLLVRSDAFIHIAQRLGGLWRITGIILSAIPAGIRDGGYRLVASIRHRLFAKPAGRCPVVPPHLRVRFRK